jgi:Flp pilus assembly protein CpaB
VVDPGTTATDPRPTVGDDAGDGRSVRRARTLPGGRAVVGALLVTAAAVSVFAAYLNATAEPDTSYLVASTTIDPGTRLTDITAVAERFEARPLDLDPDLAARAVALDDAGSLVGRLVVAPLEPGELLSRSAIVADGGVADAQTLSFPIDRASALAGALRPGERIDVLATYGSGDGAYTVYVVRGAPLVARGDEAGGSGLAGGGGGPLVLTVAVSSPEDVQALAHAVATADLVVTRSTVGPDDEDPAPGAYTPDRDRPGPAPDPAADPIETEEPAPDAGADDADADDAGAGADDADAQDED